MKNSLRVRSLLRDTMTRVAAAGIAITLVACGATTPPPAVPTPTGSRSDILAGSLNTKLNAFAVAFPGTGNTQLLRDRMVADRINSLKAAGGARILKPTGSASVGQFPWMVSIEVYQPVDNSWFHFCGGTLIAPNLVLSAAHCTDFPAEYIRVIANKIDLAQIQDIDRLVVENTEQHPDFAPVKLNLPDGRKMDGFINDVAIFHLHLGGLQSPQPTPTQSLQPIQLTSDVNKSDSIAHGIAVTLGWGVTDTGNTSSKLLFVDVPLVDDVQCEKTYSPLDPSMLCAGYKSGGGDACEGDSGGPLIVRNSVGSFEQVGVVSFGEGCGRPGYYGIYALVSAMRPWIDTRVKAVLANSHT